MGTALIIIGGVFLILLIMALCKVSGDASRQEEEAERKKNLADADRCISCGAVVPEGRMVCPNCMNGTTAHIKTNGDRVREMDDVELAAWLWSYADGSGKRACEWMDWLKGRADD